MRDIYLILNIVIAIALILLSITSLINDRKPLVNKLFLALAISVGIWLVVACVSNDVRNEPTVSLYGNYLVMLFSYFSTYLLLLFSTLITALKSAKKMMKSINTPLILIGLISGTPLVVGGVEKQGDVYAVIFGPLALLYILSLIFQLSATLWVLSEGLKQASKHKRAQIKIIQRTLIIAIPILVITQFIAPALTGSFEITDIGILGMALPVVSLYLSVIRHGLFDIRRAILRSVTYILSLITLSVVYYFLAYMVSKLLFKGNIVNGVSVSPINIVMALILAFCFQPIKKFFDKITDSFFYKGDYNSDDFFARINRVATVTNDLDELLRSSANEIASIIKIDQVFFVVQKNDDNSIVLGTNHHSRLPHDDIVNLNRAMKDSDGKILDKNYFLNNSDDEFIRRMMVSHKVELIIPLVLSNTIIGYLCLGAKKTSRFNSRDINVLDTASDELSIAIQNALAVQEIREFNTTLQQRVANATRELRASNAQLQRLDKAKDEFVSMASHQLRTPLTTVKGYISMVMDGDAGEITKEQCNLLNEAFLSSERMVNLINDFLNVSRIQTGKFIIDKRSTDLSKLIEQEVDRLRPSAASRKMEFVFERPVDFPMMDIDEGKIREVVMNFADNAIYYSHEGSKITVSLSDVDGNAVFKVKDSGIGVPIEEQSRLFSKFYRASNAKRQRPDGTGVGLFLAKKVITAHGGKVVFETVHDEGSTFGFSLPIELSAKPE